MVLSSVPNPGIRSERQREQRIVKGFERTSGICALVMFWGCGTILGWQGKLRGQGMEDIQGGLLLLGRWYRIKGQKTVDLERRIDGSIRVQDLGLRRWRV